MQAPAPSRRVTAKVQPLARDRIADLFADATLYPIRFVGDADIDFVPMTRETYRRSPFLDQRIQPAVPAVFRAKVADVEAVAPPNQAQTGARLIFHSAFCCSTLLASAVGLLPDTLALKEPVTLLQVALNDTPRARLPLVMALLNRPNDAADRVVIKASSACSMLAGDILAQDRLARAVFLYSPLGDFILAVLKDPRRAARMRETMTAPATAPLGPAGLGMHWPSSEVMPEPAKLDDARLAAWVWIGRLRAFGRMQEIAGRDRVVALDGKLVAAAPSAALMAAADSLALTRDPEAIARVVQSGLWSRHAKVPSMAYDPTAETRESGLLLDRHRAAIAGALDWARLLLDGGDDTMQTAVMLSGLQI